MMPDLPVAADGATLHEAIDEMVVALREYAADWDDHLHRAPNHRDNEKLVRVIRHASDDNLRRRLSSEVPSSDRTRTFGFMDFEVPDDFGKPIPDEELAWWE